MSNYGWVPPALDDTDSYLERLALLVSRRPNIDMIQIANTLQGFIEEANDRASPPPPIDDELVVGGHANGSYGLMVEPFPNGGSWTEFEHLELSIPGQALMVPDALVGYSPATPNPTSRAFHVKGCNVGRAQPWLVKFREALGGHVRVSAPKHFHGVSTNGTEGETPIEIIEWMGYQFVAFQKTAFSSLDALAAAFHAQGHTRPNGVPIPLAAFRAWVRLLPVRNLRTAVPKKKKVRLPLGRNIGGHRYAGGELEFHIRTPVSSVVNQAFTISAPDVIPSTDAGCRAMLLTWFQTAPEYQSAHPFPFYKRHGYSTLEAMIDGLDWRFGRDATASTVDCIGGRFEYELLIPIANPSTDGRHKPTNSPLIYNHIPESGPPITTPSFDETSPFYYGTVP